MNNKGIMFTALQRFYGALSNLDKFASANNLIDNVVCLDDFSPASDQHLLFYSVL